MNPVRTNDMSDESLKRLIEFKEKTQGFSLGSMVKVGAIVVLGIAAMSSAAYLSLHDINESKASTQSAYSVSHVDTSSLHEGSGVKTSLDGIFKQTMTVNGDSLISSGQLNADDKGYDFGSLGDITSTLNSNGRTVDLDNAGIFKLSMRGGNVFIPNSQLKGEDPSVSGQFKLNSSVSVNEALLMKTLIDKDNASPSVQTVRAISSMASGFMSSFIGDNVTPNNNTSLSRQSQNIYDSIIKTVDKINSNGGVFTTVHIDDIDNIDDVAVGLGTSFDKAQSNLASTLNNMLDGKAVGITTVHVNNESSVLPINMATLDQTSDASGFATLTGDHDGSAAYAKLSDVQIENVASLGR